MADGADLASLYSLPALTDLGPTRLDPGAPPPALTRVEGRRASALLAQVRRWCPAQPGVYGMVDRHGLLHYVGKAKNLRTRILGYFRPRGRDRRAAKIIGRARTLVWETWPSELSALLRELELIRRWRPAWNVQGQPLRRRHLFVCLGRAPAPYVFLTQQPPQSSMVHFGPVPASSVGERAIRAINDWHGLRDCPQAQEMIFPEQGELFPLERPPGCLRMELGTCLGPCTGRCSQDDYLERVAEARKLLEGDRDEPLVRLEKAMHAAAAACDFERAAALRDQLAAVHWLLERLRRLERDRASLSFIYPTWAASGQAVWYLIHASRLATVIRAPGAAADRRAAAELLQAIYVRQNHPALVEQHEHLDGALLLATWFRKYPKDRAKGLSWQKALAMTV